MTAAIHPDHLPTLRQHLAEYDRHTTDAEQMKQRRAVIASRIGALEATLAATKREFVEVLNPVPANRAEQLLTGDAGDATPPDVIAKRVRHNEAVQHRAQQIERDVMVLRHEDTRCASELERLRGLAAASRKAFAAAAGDAILAAWLENAGDDIVSRYIAPLAGTCEVAGRGGRHDPLLDLQIDAFDPTVSGLGRVNIWPSNRRNESGAAFAALIDQVRAAAPDAPGDAPEALDDAPEAA